MKKKPKQKAGYLQRSTGPKPYWEDPFVHYMGIHWREERFSLSWRQWHDRLSAFLHYTCQRWDLPLSDACHDTDDNEELTCKKFSADLGSGKEKLTFKNELPSAEELMDSVAPSIAWGRPHHCFLYVTDSQVLQGVVCGHMQLQDLTYEPLIARILDRLAEHYAKQWTPPK